MLRAPTIGYRLKSALFRRWPRTWPRTCPHLGPGRKVDGNSWDRLRLAAKFSFNLVDRAKLLSYAMLASIDGFVERIAMPT